MKFVHTLEHTPHNYNCACPNPESGFPTLTQHLILQPSVYANFAIIYF